MYNIEETTSDTIVARNFTTLDEAQRVADEYNYQAANGVWNERNYEVKADKVAAAAQWAVDQHNSRELLNGHMSRRIPIMANGYRADDNAEADAWLIQQWEEAK